MALKCDPGILINDTSGYVDKDSRDSCDMLEMLVKIGRLSLQTIDAVRVEGPFLPDVL